MLSCRKRLKTSEPVWWDDLKGKVRAAARQKAAEFEQQGIKGVDLYISTFGPVLSIISENWPVLTSETDAKTGDPLPLKPGEALDLARTEVINLRKQGLLLGRSVSSTRSLIGTSWLGTLFVRSSFPPTRLASLL